MDTSGQSRTRGEASKPESEGRREPAEEWIVTFRAAGALPPLFCVCAGGGDTYEYRDLALALPEDQPVYVFGLPPLEPGEIFPTVRRLAAIYVGEIREMQPRGPYRLCGHSFGGLVVYEIAALLAEAGEVAEFVALIDTLHPAFKRNLSARERARFQLSYFADRVARYAGNLMRGRIDRIARDIYDYIYTLGKRTAWRTVRLVFGRLRQPVPGPILSDAAILAAAWHRYEQGHYGGRLVLLNAANRPPEYGMDRTLGWGHCAIGPVELHVMPGDHLSMMHPPYVSGVAERIASYLASPEVADGAAR